jgi:hypothetical protein
VTGVPLGPLPTFLVIGAHAIGQLARTLEPEAPKRDGHVVLDASLVVILRDPVDRAYSQYWHERNLRRETLPFGQALAVEPTRTATDDVLPLPRFAYLERGRYLPLLQRVCRHYPREPLRGPSLGQAPKPGQRGSVEASQAPRGPAEHQELRVPADGAVPPGGASGPPSPWTTPLAGWLGENLSV